MNKIVRLFVVATLISLPCFAGNSFRLIMEQNVTITLPQETSPQAGEALKSLLNHKFQFEAQVVSDEGSSKATFTRAGSLFRAGEYMLIPANAVEGFIVDPSAHTYARMDLTHGGHQGPVPRQPQISAPKMELLKEEDGGSVSGLPTTHYVFLLTCEMTSNLNGQPITKPATARYEVWATDKLPGFESSTDSWIQTKTLENLAQISPELEQAIVAMKPAIKGTPVKLLMQTSMPGSRGDSIAMQQILTLSDFRTVTTQSDEFMLPSDVREVELNAMLAIEPPKISVANSHLPSGGVIGGIITSAPPQVQNPSEQRPSQTRVSAGVAQGLLTQQVPPVYPETARSSRVQGSVVLQAVIGRTGKVVNLRLVSGHPLLAPAAIDAVRQWQYKPYRINGEPVEVETVITVNFQLAGN